MNPKASLRNMAAPAHEHRLPGYVLAAVEHVIEISGFPVTVHEEDYLEFDSVVRFASPSSPQHEISYSPSYREFASHFVFSSVEKIRRYFAAPVHERLVPCMVGRGYLPADEQEELARRLICVSPRDLPAVSRQLHGGLVRQLTSFPLDARVERDLFATVSEHRDRQTAYLRRQLKDLELHFSRAIEAFSPPKTYAAASAMNCAFAEVCAGLTGERSPRGARHSAHREQGTQLVTLLNSIREPGHQGDRQVTDAWALQLGLRACYEWIRLEDVRRPW